MAFEKVADLEQVAIGTAHFADLAEPICVVRLDEDTVKAVHDTCSHQQYSLSEGWVDNNDIECSLHGSMFDLDTGEPDSLPAVKPIPTYAAKIEDGVIWVDVDQQLNDAPVPRH